MKIERSSGALWGRYSHLVHVRDYPAGHGLFEQGDAFEGLYRIERGLVGLRKVDESGSTMLVGLLGAGDFVGYGPFLVQGEHLTRAEVMQASEISFVDAKTVSCLVRDVPAFLPTLFCQATRDLARLEDRYMQMGTEQAHVRLARLLLSLHKMVGERAPACAATFHSPILNKDMADLIGVRPETLSRAISQLRTSGIADFRGHTVRVSSFSRLIRMVGGDHSGMQLAA